MSAGSKWAHLFKKENRYIFYIGFAVAGAVAYFQTIRPTLKRIEDRKIETECAAAFRKRYPHLVKDKREETQLADPALQTPKKLTEAH